MLRTYQIHRTTAVQRLQGHMMLLRCKRTFIYLDFRGIGQCDYLDLFIYAVFLCQVSSISTKAIISLWLNRYVRAIRWLFDLCICNLYWWTNSWNLGEHAVLEKWRKTRATARKSTTHMNNEPCQQAPLKKMKDHKKSSPYRIRTAAFKQAQPGTCICTQKRGARSRTHTQGDVPNIHTGQGPLKKSRHAPFSSPCRRCP